MKHGDFFSTMWRRVLDRWCGPPLDESSWWWLRLTGAGVVMLALTLPLLAAWHVRRNALNYWATVPDYGLVAVFVWFALAVWLLTWPERSTGHAVAASPALSWRATRWVLRALSPVPALAAVVAVRSEFVSVVDHPPWAAAGASLLWVSPVLSFLLFDYLAYLAARVPAMGTAGALRLLLCAACVPSTLSAFASVNHNSEPHRAPEVIGGTMDIVLRECAPVGTLMYGGTLVLLAALGLRILFLSSGGSVSRSMDTHRPTRRRPGVGGNA